MSFPKEIVSLFTNDGVRENKYDYHNQKKKDTRNTRERLKKPISNRRLEIAWQANFFRKAAQVFNWLSRNVVKVHYVAHSMEQGKKESCEGADFVKLNMGIERDILLD